MVLGLSTVSWAADYIGPGNGAVRASQFIAARLPACAAVNASGDAQKYSYMLGGRSLPSFYVGPAALADGVHYFLLAPNDATERDGNMSPALATWIRDNGQRLADYPSPVYRTVQLWHVAASPYDPVADIIDISDGVFINAIGSDCGGYSVTDGATGAFYSGYQALGGKGVVGEPLSRVTGAGGSGHEQLFDGAVLASAAGSQEVHPMPVVALMARRFPAAYRRAGLPPVTAGARATTAERRGLLSNGLIRRAYLGGAADTLAAYAAAVRRYGVPLGPPKATARAGREPGLRQRGSHGTGTGRERPGGGRDPHRARRGSAQPSAGGPRPADSAGVAGHSVTRAAGTDVGGAVRADARGCPDAFRRGDRGRRLPASGAEGRRTDDGDRA